MRLAHFLFRLPFRSLAGRFGRRLLFAGTAIAAWATHATAQTNDHWTAGSGN